MLLFVFMSQKVGADLNGHVGESNLGFEGVHGGKGYGDRNDAGLEIIESCMAHELCILNTMFIKQQRHLITYSSGGCETQIDYHLCSRQLRSWAKDCKVILGEIRGIVNAPWYIRNDDLHRDLKIETVASAINKNAVSHTKRLTQHVNEEAARLLNTAGIERRLKRKKPGDLARL